MRALIILIIIIALGGLYALRIRPTRTMPAPTPILTPSSTPTSSPTASELPLIAEVMVTIDSSGFTPKTVTIRQRDKITWQNESGLDISINSDPHPSHTAYPPLNLGRLPDLAAVTLIFDLPGIYNYHNHFRPSQTGTIIVTEE